MRERAPIMAMEASMRTVTSHGPFSVNAISRALIRNLYAAALARRPSNLQEWVPFAAALLDKSGQLRQHLIHDKPRRFLDEPSATRLQVENARLVASLPLSGTAYRGADGHRANNRSGALDE
jgi:hypothetical protein